MMDGLYRIYARAQLHLEMLRLLTSREDQERTSRGRSNHYQQQSLQRVTRQRHLPTTSQIQDVILRADSTPGLG